MKLTLMGFALPLVFVATSMCGQQVSPASPQTGQPVAVKNSGTPDEHAKASQKSRAHRRPVRHRRASRGKRARRAAYRPAYTQNSVEVMNGASTQKVVFKNDEQAPMSQRDKAATGYKVEVLNGTAQDTEYFNATNAGTGSDEKRPVVVAVQSSDTRVAGGNKYPVVTNITAAGQGSVKSMSGGGQKVTTGISPKPKRPAYQPDGH